MKQRIGRNDITLTVDPSGFVFMSGPIYEDPARWDELFVAKFAPDGQMLWQRDINRKSSLAHPYESFTSSAPPAHFNKPDDDEDERDSFSPHAVDHDAGDALEQLELQLSGRSRIGRALGYAAGFAFLVAVGFLSAAGFHQGRMQAAADRVAAARSANLQDAAAVAIDNAHDAMSAALAAEATYAGEPSISEPAAQPVERVAPPMIAYEEPLGGMGGAAEATSASSAPLLRAETLKLLNSGKYGEAVDAARAYVSVDPDNAHSHLCLGAALQSLGRAAEARVAYSACVEQAKRGSVWECRALK